MRQLRETAAPELARELQLAEQRRLQKIERKTKATARQAAKEAAAEARAQQLAKEQVERDRKEQARQQTLQARNRVRAQLRQVQQQAKTKLKVFGSPTQSTTADQAKHPSAATGGKPLVDSAPPKVANPTVPDATPDASSLAIIPYVEPPPQTGKRHEPPSPTASEAGPPASKGRFFEQDAATDDFEPSGEDAITTNRDETPHQGASPIAAGAEPAEADNAKPTARRAQRQLPLSAFFAPQTLVDAQAQLDQEIAMRQLRPVDHWLSQFPSPLLDSILHQLWTPSTLEDWKSAFRARIVKTPANGGCLHFAVHGCRARYIRGEEMFVCRTTVHEGNHYKDGMCNSLLEYLSQMLEDGTVTLTDFNRRFFGLGPPEDRDAAECAIRRFIEGIRGATLSHGLTRDQWGSDEDIFGLVWYVREPVIVIAEDAESQRTTVRVVRLERHVARGPEKIEQLFPEPAEAFEIVRTFLRHRVLPTILVFRPNNGNGHFDSFRFHDSLYKEWTTDDKEGLAMRARMDQVLVALGWYVAPLTSHGIPKHAPIDLISDSDSAYVPSEPMTSTPTPPSSPPFLSPPAAHALTSALNPRRRRRGVLANLWQQAEAANLVAYRLWDAQQDDCADRDKADTVNAGCGYWSRSTVQLVALRRSLPYPEVALSLLPPALLLRLGNELNALAQDSAVPDFVIANDPENARFEWARLVALVAVISTDNLIDLRCIEWLKTHQDETVAALHDLRLHDWTVGARLALASETSLPTQPADHRQVASRV